jgi:hypothetical protein
MAKRIYISTLAKWGIGIGATGIPLALLLFWYLSSLGAIAITGFSGDQICAGTNLNPCIAYINMTAKEDIFIYPDKNWSGGFYTNGSVKSVKMYRSWGDGWREINLTTNCKGTWCGASDSSGNTSYSFAFRHDTKYNLKFEVIKSNVSDSIKWGYADVDPYFYGVNNSDKIYSEYSKAISIFDKTSKREIAYSKLDSHTPTCLIDCSSEGTSVLKVDMPLFERFDFYDKNGRNINLTYDFFIKQNVTSNYSIPIFNETNQTVGYENHSYTVEKWVKYNFTKLPAGIYHWKIEGKKDPHQSIDWVGTVNGLKLTDFAWWNSLTGNYQVFNTTETSNFTVPLGIVNVSVLIVAGGGGGGHEQAGGGGAGGLILNSSYAVTAITNISVTVGDGGAGASGAPPGTNGSNSIFGTLIAYGGGGGGTCGSAALNGGSGGGAAACNPPQTGGSGITGQGYAGGNQASGGYGAGGGGANQSGADGGTTAVGLGGNGLYVWGLSYVGGGGGGGGATGATGGLGGGANGGSSGVTGDTASANTGGGGGGGGSSGGLGGNGGSGLVVVRWTAGAVPTINLNNPINNQNFSASSIIFSVTPLSLTKATGLNVSIYGNWSGSWAVNQTNSTAKNNTQTNFTVAGIPDGTWIWNALVNDGVNFNWSLANYTFTIDTTPPVITLPVYVNATKYKNTQNITFNISAIDAIMGANYCSINVNGNANQTLLVSNGWCNGTYALTGLSDGNKTINAYANDTLGNTGLNRSYVAWLVINPIASFGTNPIDNYNSSSRSVTFDFKASDNVGVNTIQLYGNWSGSWMANYTNSSYVNDTWLNITITGIPEGYFTWGIFTNDTAGNYDWTDTNRTLKVYSSYRIFFNNVEGNNTAEVGLINLYANGSIPSSNFCLSIDHPDYGTNYTCGNPINMTINISYFRNNLFLNGSSFTISQNTNQSMKSLWFLIHGKDEINAISFNISNVTGVIENPTFFFVNTTPTYSNNTFDINSSPFVDRAYNGYLKGGNIFLNSIANPAKTDEFTSQNITFYTKGDLVAYILLDDILKAGNIYSFLLNLTGFNFGVNYHDGSVASGSYPGSDSLYGFMNYSNIDTILTTAQLDPSGVIMAQNTSAINNVYDNFDGATVDMSKWLYGNRGSCPLTGNQYCEKTLSGDLYLGTHGQAGSASINDYSSANISLLESPQINISFSMDSNIGDIDTNSFDMNNKVYFGNTIVYSLPRPVPFQACGNGNSQATINMVLTKVNRTTWKNQLYGNDNYTSPKPSCDDVTTTTYTGVPSYFLVDNTLSSFIQFYTSSSSVYGMSTDMYIHNVTRIIYTRANSSVVSKSIYDSSANIVSVTPSIVIGSVAPAINETNALYLSADNGLHWESATSDVLHIFTNPGNNLKWRVNFNITGIDDLNATNKLIYVNMSIPLSYPSNISIDWGNDGIIDGNYSGTFNTTYSYDFSNINLSNAFTNASLFYPNGHLYFIPLKISSDTAGTIQISNVNFTYSPNPISLNTSAIQNYLNALNSNTYFNMSIPFSFMNATTGTSTLNFSRLNQDYVGGNKSYQFTVSSPWLTGNITNSIIYYRSSFVKLLPYSWTDYIFFLPKTNSSKNVSAYGQTNVMPLYRINMTGYGGKDANVSIRLNQSFSCLNITWNNNSFKPNGNLLNTSYTEIKSQAKYLENLSIWLWADLSQCNASDQRILNPNLQVRANCHNCLIAT